MGREALCICLWKGRKSNVKVLLEPPELILRGDLREKIPIGEMKSIHADGDQLRFIFQDQPVALALGGVLSQKWAEALLKPPPTLAKKLGISKDTTVGMIGPADDAALNKALEEAKAVSSSKADILLARVDTPAQLHSVLLKMSDRLQERTPIWFIYRKGKGHPLNEALIRSTALREGIVDTKVAAVSDEFTALRFVKRQS